MRRPVVLLAVGPAVLALVRELLGDEFELVPVRTRGEAFERLAQGGIDVILAGLRFDDSAMPALLEAVKSDAATRDIPFICCRFLPALLQRASLRAASKVCEALGAQAFVDVLELEEEQGRKAAGAHLRRVLLSALPENAGRMNRP